MESSGNKKFFFYVLTLAGIFFVFYGLDAFFGVHYEPEAHRLNQKKESVEATHSSGHSEVSLSTSKEANKEVDMESNTDNRLKEDPLFNDHAKMYWMAAIFLISITLAIRTFRNKPTA